jgi:hypothetical protein
MATDEKKNEILLPNSYFSINANNRTWFFLDIPSNLVKSHFSECFHGNF